LVEAVQQQLLQNPPLASRRREQEVDSGTPQEVFMTRYLAFGTKLFILCVLGLCLPGFDASAAPSYDCTKVEQGSIEELVCTDEGLSALDLKLAEVYRAAAKKAVNEHPPFLKAEQRGWIKGRNDCWKSDDIRQCVAEQYTLRIAELQARYRLVSGIGPVFYTCEEGPADEFIITFFQTEPPTLIAERGDSVSLMYLQPSASGTRYQGRNESFWEHQGEALIIWGYGAQEKHCKKRR